MTEANTISHPRGQLFLDMDGVLADFTRGFEAMFGEGSYKALSPLEHKEDVWKRIHDSGTFWRDLYAMSDAAKLWDFCYPYQPIILTAKPKSHTSAVEAQKKWWAKRNFKTDRVIVCVSDMKYVHCTPGDILVDDRMKLCKQWTDAGGIFVHHISADATISALKELGYT